VVELIIGNLKFHTANMYLDITEKLDKGNKFDQKHSATSKYK